MNKNILIILGTLACASLCFAPHGDAKGNGGKGKRAFTRQGTFTIGGDLSFQSMTPGVIIKGEEQEDDKPTTNSSFGLSPRVGYFVFSNKMIAVEVAALLSIASSGSERDGKESGSMSSWGVGLDVPVYLRMMRRNQLFPFAHFSFMRQSMTTQADPDADEVSVGGNQMRAGVGISYALGRKRGGFAKLTLDYVIENSFLDEDDNGLNNTGLDIGLGFGLFF